MSWIFLSKPWGGEIENLDFEVNSTASEFQIGKILIWQNDYYIILPILHLKSSIYAVQEGELFYLTP